MKTLKFRKFKAFSLCLILLVIATFGCNKDKEAVTKPEANRIYELDGKEYTVKMVREGNNLAQVENETTKMLDEAMEGPTSSTYVNAETGKVFLFRTSGEADIFAKKIRQENQLKRNKNLKDGVSWGFVCFQNYVDDPIKYPYGSTFNDISGSLYPEEYTAGDYDYPDLTIYNCDDQISQVDLHANSNGDGTGITVTLCENPNKGGHRIGFFSPTGDSFYCRYFYLRDYVMAKSGFRKTYWDNQTSSIFINL